MCSASRPRGVLRIRARRSPRRRELTWRRATRLRDGGDADGRLSDDAVVKVAQRSAPATPEIDALGKSRSSRRRRQPRHGKGDHVACCRHFGRALANKHTRKPTGVVGFDNREGLPLTSRATSASKTYVSAAVAAGSGVCVAYVDAHSTTRETRHARAPRLGGRELRDRNFLNAASSRPSPHHAPRIEFDYDGSVRAEGRKPASTRHLRCTARVLAVWRGPPTSDGGELLRSPTTERAVRSFERDPFEHQMSKIADASVRMHPQHAAGLAHTQRDLRAREASTSAAGAQAEEPRAHSERASRSATGLLRSRAHTPLQNARGSAIAQSAPTSAP